MNMPTTAEYEAKGWQAGMRCQPDCRHHYNEPWQSAYAKGYDAAVEYRRREGIDFYAAKAAMAARSEAWMKFYGMAV